MLISGPVTFGSLLSFCYQAFLSLNVRFATAIDTRCYKLYYHDVLAQHEKKCINTTTTRPSHVPIRKLCPSRGLEILFSQRPEMDTTLHCL